MKMTADSFYTSFSMVCNKCGIIFPVDEESISYQEHENDRTEEMHAYNCIICPGCNCVEVLPAFDE